MADDKSRPTNKRRLKNPETVREQALRTRQTEARPARSAGVRRTTSRLLAPTKKMGKLLNFKPLRWLSLVIAPPYLRSSFRELKLVTWPNRKQSRQLTVAVIIFSIIFGVLVALADLGLDKIFKNVLLK